jgi:Ca2+-binding EF-hand superfamily protein
MEIDPVNSAITLLAELSASGKLKAKNSQGDDVTDKDLLVKLLTNPNENQNFDEFWKDLMFYFYSSGYCYLLPYSESVGYETRLDLKTANAKLFALNPDYYDFKNNTFSFKNLFGLENPVRFDYMPLSIGNIFYSNVVALFDIRQDTICPYTGVSRLKSLEQPIENWWLSMLCKKNFFQRTGGVVVSATNKMDDLALDSETIDQFNLGEDGEAKVTTQKENLQNQLRNTSLVNDGLGITYSSIQLQKFNLSDGLEKINFDNYSLEDARRIFNAFNIPLELANLTKETAKYDNKNIALKQLIQMVIKPTVDRILEKIVKKYNHDTMLYIDYSELPMFAEDMGEKVTNQQVLVTMYMELLTAGKIDDKLFNQIMEENGIIPKKAT